MKGITIRLLTPLDYESCLAIWRATGIKIRPGDEPAGFGSMLERNPGLCLGAILNEALVGCVLGGWDGRRGWVHHLAVHPDYQRRGLGQALMADLEQRFAALGVPIVNLLVYCENSAAMAFYERLGYAVKPVVEMGKSLKAE